MPAQGRSGPHPPGREQCRGQQRRHRSTTRSSSARGVIGLACAWRPPSAGSTWRVLERERPGRAPPTSPPGCSRRSARSSWGEERLLELALELRTPSGRAFAAELAAAGGLPSRATGDIGALHVALDRDEAAELRRRFELQRDLGLEAEWLRAARVPRARARARRPDRRRGARAARGRGRSAPDRWRGARRGRSSRRWADRDRAEACEALRERRQRSTGVRTAAGDELRAPVTVLAAGCVVGAPIGCPGPARPPVRPRQGPDPRPARRPGGDRPASGSSSASASTACRAPTAGWSSAPRSRSRASTRAVTAGGVPRAAARGLPGAPRGRRAGAGRDDRRAAARRPPTTCR